jgi:hypothetical protein
MEPSGSHLIRKGQLLEMTGQCCGGSTSSQQSFPSKVMYSISQALRNPFVGVTDAFEVDIITMERNNFMKPTHLLRSLMFTKSHGYQREIARQNTCDNVPALFAFRIFSGTSMTSDSELVSWHHRISAMICHPPRHAIWKSPTPLLSNESGTVM